jgi:hypothetical protein
MQERRQDSFESYLKQQMAKSFGKRFFFHRQNLGDVQQKNMTDHLLQKINEKVRLQSRRASEKLEAAQ